MKQNLYFIMFPFLILVFLLPQRNVNCQEKTQTLKLWMNSTDRNCDRSQDLIAYDGFVRSINSGPLYNIYYQANGLWSMELCYNETDCPIRHLLISSSNCSYLHLDGYHTKYIIKRFGDADQIKPMIHFYTEENLLGNLTIVGQEGMNGTEGIVAKSYFFTGPYSWAYTISSADPYLIWLKPTESVINDGFGITTNLHTYLKIHSVEMKEQEDPSATTAITTTTLEHDSSPATVTEEITETSTIITTGQSSITTDSISTTLNVSLGTMTSTTAENSYSSTTQRNSGAKNNKNSFIFIFLLFFLTSFSISYFKGESVLLR